MLKTNDNNYYVAIKLGEYAIGTPKKKGVWNEIVSFKKIDNAYPITNTNGVLFFVYYDKVEKKWVITEPTSGMKFGGIKANSKTDAMEIASGINVSYNEEKQIKEHIELHGYTPRYMDTVLSKTEKKFLTAYAMAKYAKISLLDNASDIGLLSKDRTMELYFIGGLQQIRLNGQQGYIKSTWTGELQPIPDNADDYFVATKNMLHYRPSFLLEEDFQYITPPVQATTGASDVDLKGNKKELWMQERDIALEQSLKNREKNVVDFHKALDSIAASDAQFYNIEIYSSGTLLSYLPLEKKFVYQSKDFTNNNHLYGYTPISEREEQELYDAIATGSVQLTLMAKSKYIFGDKGLTDKVLIKANPRDFAGKLFDRVYRSEVQQAIRYDRYLDAIKDGKMTAHEAIRIIEREGFDVPAAIKSPSLSQPFTKVGSYLSQPFTKAGYYLRSYDSTNSLHTNQSFAKYFAKQEEATASNLQTARHLGIYELYYNAIIEKNFFVSASAIEGVTLYQIQKSKNKTQNQ